MNLLDSGLSPCGRTHTKHLARRLLAAWLAVVPCLGWAVDSGAARPHEDGGTGYSEAFSTGHTLPEGQTFADAVADPRTTAIEASDFGQSMADAHAAPARSAGAFPLAEAATTIGIATPITAVPESHTYLQILVGLGAMAFVVRRRRRWTD